MSDYVVGIDLGTTYSAAAVLRGGRLEVVELGERIASVASVLWFRDDDRVVVGEAAVRRAEAEPGRMAREFKRRFGDPVPLSVAGKPMFADALTARLLRWVVDAVIRQEDGESAGVALAHPANWGPYKLDLLRQVVRQARVNHAVLISEPHAAAESHATAARVAPGDVVAVYDLGGGTFDAAVLKRIESGFELVGRAEGIERLGGIDFDEAVFQHVCQVLSPRLTDLNYQDPVVAGTLLRLREECARAKEALSSDTEAIIPVALPDLHTSVRLTRGEFEEMIRPSVTATIETLSRAIISAGMTPAQVSKVLLVGGSSRIPLVSLMLSAELGRPVALDTHPKHAVAMGAAHLVGRGAPVVAAVPKRSATLADSIYPSTLTLPLSAPEKSSSLDPPRRTSSEVGQNTPLSWEQWKAHTATSTPSGSRRRGPHRRHLLLILIGVLLVGGAVAAVVVGILPVNKGQAQPADAFQSDELRQFAGSLLDAPGASCAPSAENERKGQREAVDCRWENGVQGRFYLAADRADLENVRGVFLSDTETVPGSFSREAGGWRNTQPGTPGVRQGEYSQYILAKDKLAYIYYDQESTLSWAELWLPSRDRQKLRDFWLAWT
ncbi:MAG: Hsp70 family protein [Pseudonocardiaceae bacterium]